MVLNFQDEEPRFEGPRRDQDIKTEYQDQDLCPDNYITEYKELFLYQKQRYDAL